MGTPATPFSPRSFSPARSVETPSKKYSVRTNAGEVLSTFGPQNVVKTIPLVMSTFPDVYLHKHSWSSASFLLTHLSGMEIKERQPCICKRVTV